jgi:hypothetical protein
LPEIAIPPFTSTDPESKLEDIELSEKLPVEPKNFHLKVPDPNSKFVVPGTNVDEEESLKVAKV